MASRVQMMQRPDGGTSYLFGPMRIHLYDDYLIWSKGVLGVQESTIYYRDIISVSYSNGGLFANAFFQINTAGQIYQCGFTCAASGLEVIDQDIRERQSQSYNNGNSIIEELLQQLISKSKDESNDDKSKEQTEKDDYVNKSANDIKSTPAITYNAHVNPNNIKPTLTRIELLIEDKEWEKASAYIETALDYFPTDYRLYLLMLRIDHKMESAELLGQIAEQLQDNRTFLRMRRFASEEELESIEREMFPAQYETYHHAIELRDSGDYLGALFLFQEIENYRDASEQAQLIAINNKEDLYQIALRNKEEGNVNDALKAFQNIIQYKDSEKQCKELTAVIEEKRCEPIYQKATEFYKEKSDYAMAYNLFREIAEYKDSAKLAQYCYEMQYQNRFDMDYYGE